MNKYQCVLMACVLAAAGCTDSIESVTREYRAANNECIDALMMVTSETDAKRLNPRIFKPMQGRYEQIDRKLENVRRNSKKSELIKACLESDSVQLYLTDLQLNAQRLSLERLRINRLINQYLDQAKESNPNATAQEVCPSLVALVSEAGGAGMGPGGGPGGGGPGGGLGPPPGGDGGAAGGPPMGGPGGPAMGGMGMGGGGPSWGLIEPLRKQMFDNEMLKIMDEFNNWKIAAFPDMHKKFIERRKDFLPKEKIVLVE